VEDVDVWCYAMLELHARNDDEADFCVDCKLTVLTDILIYLLIVTNLEGG